jgi:hypothetical protein
MIYRLYYNRSEDAPWLWSYDQGTQDTEQLLRDYRLHGCDVRAGVDMSVPGGAKDRPKVWLAVEAKHVEAIDGVGHFYGRWTDSGYPLMKD